jgi:hypothetical protein
MEVKLEKWFRPKIDKEVLKELSKKSNLQCLNHIVKYFSFTGLKLVSLLIILGELGGQLFWFLIYGNIYWFS